MIEEEEAVDEEGREEKQQSTKQRSKKLNNKTDEKIRITDNFEDNDNNEEGRIK